MKKTKAYYLLIESHGGEDVWREVHCSLSEIERLCHADRGGTIKAIKIYCDPEYFLAGRPSSPKEYGAWMVRCADDPLDIRVLPMVFQNELNCGNLN